MIHLLQISAECAPMVAPSTMAAIVRVESGGNPLAMWNNSTRSMVAFENRNQAVRYLRQAMATGQRVDVGLAQVDTENFAAFGLTPGTAFNACANLRAGSEILRMDWQQALASGYRGQKALYHAFEAYNSGRLWGDAQYANRILGAAEASAPIEYGRLRYASKVEPVNKVPTNTLPQFRWQAKPAPATTPAPSSGAGSWPVLP
jgi:type IV secretion system protein VirB1